MVQLCVCVCVCVCASSQAVSGRIVNAAVAHRCFTTVSCVWPHRAANHWSFFCPPRARKLDGFLLCSWLFFLVPSMCLRGNVRDEFVALVAPDTLRVPEAAIAFEVILRWPAS